MLENLVFRQRPKWLRYQRDNFAAQRPRITGLVRIGAIRQENDVSERYGIDPEHLAGETEMTLGTHRQELFAIRTQWRAEVPS